MKISVLICTRNRAGSLEATLGRFFAQRFAGGYGYELIVVDNGSTDGTSQIVEQCRTQHPQAVRHLFEHRQGLAFARNTAVAAAQGEVIAFTDDDVLVSDDWLDQIHREFTDDPALRMLGGRVLLAGEEQQQVAWLRSDERAYFGLPDGVNFVMGANMAFRREFFDCAGLFDVRLGTGRFFEGADDVELIYRGLKAGYRLLYAPNVLVYHNHDRVTPEQACRLEYGYAKSCSAYLVKHSLGGDGYALRMLYWTLCTLPKRWRRKREDSDDAFVRRRWQIKGTLVGLCAAPFVMWGRVKD
jgi:glycosyltransferase involved in cell wall biosynthesis